MPWVEGPQTEFAKYHEPSGFPTLFLTWGACADGLLHRNKQICEINISKAALAEERL